MHVFVGFPDEEIGGECRRTGFWRWRLAVGHLATGAERERKSGVGDRRGDGDGERGGGSGDKSLESRLLEMQRDKRVKKPVIALKIRLQSITLDFTRPASNKRAVIYELSVKE